jgi:hypothetical protein
VKTSAALSQAFAAALRYGMPVTVHETFVDGRPVEAGYALVRDMPDVRRQHPTVQENAVIFPAQELGAIARRLRNLTHAVDIPLARRQELENIQAFLEGRK